MIYKIIVCVVYFIILYLNAFFSVRDYYKDFPHFLGVEAMQWVVIFLLWLPCLLIFRR